MLTSTTTSAETQFTPELIVDDTPQELNLPTTPIGTIFFEKGYEREAYRFERCGKVLYRRCPNKHVDRRIRHNCEFRYACTYCSEQLARESFKIWLPVINQVMKELKGLDFMTVDMWVKAERSPSAIRQAMEDVKTYLAGNFVDQETGHWTLPVGFTGEWLKVRSLVTMSSNMDVSKWSISGVDFIAEWRQHPIHQLATMFQKFLLKPLIIEDLRDAVEQEIIFKNIHRLRSAGLPNAGPAADVPTDFSVEVQPKTEKYVVEQHAHDKCRVCGEKFVEVAANWEFSGPVGAVKWQSLCRRE